MISGSCHVVCLLFFQMLCNTLLYNTHLSCKELLNDKTETFLNFRLNPKFLCRPRFCQIFEPLEQVSPELDNGVSGWQWTVVLLNVGGGICLPHLYAVQSHNHLVPQRVTPLDQSGCMINRILWNDDECKILYITFWASCSRYKPLIIMMFALHKKYMSLVARKPVFVVATR